MNDAAHAHQARRSDRRWQTDRAQAFPGADKPDFEQYDLRRHRMRGPEISRSPGRGFRSDTMSAAKEREEQVAKYRRQHHHAADGQKPVSPARSLALQESRGILFRSSDGAPAEQGKDHGNISEYHRILRRHLRSRARSAVLLRYVGSRSYPEPGELPRGDHAQSEILSAPQIQLPDQQQKRHHQQDHQQHEEE